MVNIITEAYKKDSKKTISKLYQGFQERKGNNTEIYQSKMGKRTGHRDIAGGLASNVENTTLIHKFKEVERIWLEKFDSFLHHSPH